MKHIILLGCGFVFLGLGAVGLALPVWPTTPFVLLAAGCFSTSPAMHRKLMKLGFFREHYENYRNRTGLSKKTLASSLAYLWGMLLLSVVLTRRMWLSLLLLAVGAAVTIHLLALARPKEKSNGSQL